MKYKVGDKVRVREDLKDGARWNVTPEMLAYKGMVATVIGFIGMSNYRLDIDSEKWSWSDEMLEEVATVELVEQVIEELKAERDAIKAKNKKAGQMIARGQLDQEQNYLLAAQASAYKTVCHILDIRIRSLKKQVPVPEPEPKKYNVIAWVSPQDETKRSFWYRREVAQGVGVSTSSYNRDSNQQWTLAQIKEYGLEDCKRIEVQND